MYTGITTSRSDMYLGRYLGGDDDGDGVVFIPYDLCRQVKPSYVSKYIPTYLGIQSRHLGRYE